jgi:hypothetical protein
VRVVAVVTNAKKEQPTMSVVKEVIIAPTAAQTRMEILGVSPKNAKPHVKGV